MGLLGFCGIPALPMAQLSTVKNCNPWVRTLIAELFGLSKSAGIPNSMFCPIAVDAVALKEGDRILFGLDSRGTVKVGVWLVVVAGPEWCTHAVLPQNSQDPRIPCQHVPCLCPCSLSQDVSAI